MRFTDCAGHRICRLRPAMGTLVALEARAESEARAIAAIDAAFAAILRVEARMHPARAGSDLVAIHAAGAGQPVHVDEWTCQVLALAQRIERLSGGVFDPCLPGMPGSIVDIRLDAPGVAIPLADLRLDLGGIAKGFAVDKAVEALESFGCTSGIVNAGGDLRTFGAPRPVLIRAHDGPASWFALGDEALAVSDPQSPSRPAGHRGYYVRRRATGVRRASDAFQTLLRSPSETPTSPPAIVVARSAAVADALTKVVLLAEPNVTRPLLDALGATEIRFADSSIAEPVMRRRRAS